MHGASSAGLWPLYPLYVHAYACVSSEIVCSHTGSLQNLCLRVTYCMGDGQMCKGIRRFCTCIYEGVGVKETGSDCLTVLPPSGVCCHITIVTNSMLHIVYAKCRCHVSLSRTACCIVCGDLLGPSFLAAICVRFIHFGLGATSCVN